MGYLGTAIKLCQSHQHHCDLEAKEEAKQTVLTHRFKSSFDGKLADEDVHTKESLSSFGYEMWHNSVVQYEMLQSALDPETDYFHVWPPNETFDNDLHIIFSICKRCARGRSIGYDIQYKHEFKVDPMFKIKDWSHRWLTRK